jgi:hypothetical protein
VVYWEFRDVSGKLTAFILNVAEFPENGGRSFSENPINFYKLHGVTRGDCTLDL